MNQHIETIKAEFTKQAQSFNDYQQTFSKDDVTAFAVEHMGMDGRESVLEVAAGTCGFGRSIANQVRHITELDITPAMLEIGMQEGKIQGIDNQSFVIGMAENMPFLNATFDMVVSRLAFHHFQNPSLVFGEMARVVKPQGKIVVLDMEARAEDLRQQADNYETLRDPSHTKCLSQKEFAHLGCQHGYRLDFCQTILVPVDFTHWLALTKTPDAVAAEIMAAVKQDLEGGTPMGLSPYEKDGDYYFNHKWMLCVFTQDGAHPSL